MKNLDLNTYGVKELTSKELLTNDGGSLESIWDSVKKDAEYVAGAVVGFVKGVYKEVTS